MTHSYKLDKINVVNIMSFTRDDKECISGNIEIQAKGAGDIAPRINLILSLGHEPHDQSISEIERKLIAETRLLLANLSDQIPD